METASHDGRTTAYRVVEGDGTGPTVLYVHGSGGVHRVWAKQYAPNGPAHPAVAVDLSGHGASDDVETAPGTATLSAYADDVVAVARATDADVLVGNSLGGAVAQWVALGGEWRPDALVLLGTGPTLPVFDMLRGWLASDFERAVEFLHGRNRLFHADDGRLHERSREAMHAVGRTVTERDFLTCHGFDVTDRLSEIGAPTLALCGEHDQLIPRSSHERLVAGLPNGEFAVVLDAAHLAMFEQPAVCNGMVTDFLDARLG